MSTTTAPPEQIYCLKCKDYQSVVEPKLEGTSFETKSGKKMSRQAWRGKCGKCGCSVSRWAKTDKPVKEAEVAPTPQ